MADEGSYVSYIEGCSAPVRDSYQLHAAVVEVIIHKDAEVKYSTVQNWFPGDGNTGGILNFVTKRALCEGENSKMSRPSRKPALPSLGNTRAVFCVGITRSVSSTPWR